MICYFTLKGPPHPQESLRGKWRPHPQEPNRESNVANKIIKSNIDPPSEKFWGYPKVALVSFFYIPLRGNATTSSSHLPIYLFYFFLILYFLSTIIYFFYCCSIYIHFSFCFLLYRWGILSFLYLYISMGYHYLFFFIIYFLFIYILLFTNYILIMAQPLS
jgi:hypothetical protein